MTKQNHIKNKLDLWEKSGTFFLNVLDQGGEALYSVEFPTQELRSRWIKRNKKSTFVDTTQNLCRYCGRPNGSNNPDVLCPKCRQNFGHSLYSEL